MEYLLSHGKKLTRGVYLAFGHDEETLGGKGQLQIKNLLQKRGVKLEAVLDEFDSIIGLDKLKAVHLNDSMMPFGKKKDRHSVIGEGEIGLEAILRFMSHPKIKHLPFYLETPLEEDGHKEEIKMLKGHLNIK